MVVAITFLFLLCLSVLLLYGLAELRLISETHMEASISSGLFSIASIVWLIKGWGGNSLFTQSCKQTHLIRLTWAIESSECQNQLREDAEEDKSVSHPISD